MKSMNLFGTTKPKKKTYTEDFKKKAVKLASKAGVTKAAEELGISTSSIYSWQKTLGTSTLAKSSTPIQDEDGNLTFNLEGKTYSLNVNSAEERERVKEEVHSNSLAKYNWFKEEAGEKHWILYNTEIYEIDDEDPHISNLHYKKDCNLNPVIPINATSCYHMFSNCGSLTKLDLSSFDTSNVTTMYNMFSNCPKLTSLDLSNFDTSKVTNMFDMFSCCQNLIELDLSSFDTCNVTNMGLMFYDCRSLTQLDLSNFDTSKVTSMWEMFNWCRSLTNLDLSNFNTNNVTEMDYMFQGCKSLTQLDLSSFDTSKIACTTEMFAYCEKLTIIKISNQWNVNSVKYSDDMFKDCKSLPNFSSEKTNIEMAKPIEEGGYLTLKKVA